MTYHFNPANPEVSGREVALAFRRPAGSLAGDRFRQGGIVSPPSHRRAIRASVLRLRSFHAVNQELRYRSNSPRLATGGYLTHR